MKNLVKTSLLAVLMFVAVGAHAYDETFSLKVKSNAEKSIMFFVREAQDLEFSIYDADNEVLYRQKIHVDQPAAKTYNLQAFPDGTYLIKLESHSKITTYQLQIIDGKTIVEKPVIMEKFNPVLTKNEGVVTLKLENTGNDPVEIKIVNEENDQLYNKVFNDKKLNKKFNIGQTNAKELTFIVRLKDQEFIKTVAVN